MKKFCLILITLIVLLTSIGCGQETKKLSIKIINKPLTECVITQEELELGIEYSTPTTQVVGWSSSNIEVASVDDSGVVTFNGVGVTIITATIKDDGSIKDSFELKIVDSPIEIINKPLNGVVDLVYDNDVALGYNVLGEDAFLVEWSSSNTGVALISDDGKVDVKGVGSTVIKVKSKTNKYFYDSFVLSVIDSSQSDNLFDTFTNGYIDEQNNLRSKFAYTITNAKNYDVETKFGNKFLQLEGDSVGNVEMKIKVDDLQPSMRYQLTFDYSVIDGECNLMVGGTEFKNYKNENNKVYCEFIPTSKESEFLIVFSSDNSFQLKLDNIKITLYDLDNVVGGGDIF